MYASSTSSDWVVSWFVDRSGGGCGARELLSGSESASHAARLQVDGARVHLHGDWRLSLELDLHPALNL